MEIFHFYDYDSYKFKLGRQRACHLDYINNLEDINVTRSGINWPNWDNDRDIYENILDICKKEPDIVIGYINNNTQTYVLHDFANLPILKMLMFIELRTKLQQKLKVAKPDIVTYAYPQDENKSLIPNTKWYYLPNVIASSVFCCYTPFQDRDIDISIYGASNVRAYPLRMRMLEAICQLSEDFNCYVHPNPGPRFPYANSNKHLADLSQMLNRSKITCTCSSIYKCRVNKFSEIPTCGSIICSDMPIVNEYKGALRNCIIEVPPDANVGQLKYTLYNALQDKQLLLSKHKRSLQYASYYTIDRYIDMFMDIIRKEVNGK